MNRKLAAVLSLVAVSFTLFGCSRTPAPAPTTRPIAQPSAVPYRVAPSGCRGASSADNSGDWCPAPQTLKLGAFRVAVGDGWIARFVTNSDATLAKPGGYDTVTISDQIALVVTNPHVGVSALLSGLVIPGAVDLKPEPNVIAPIGFEVAACSYTFRGSRYYDVLMIQGDHALHVVGSTPYPYDDANVYLFNTQHLLLSVKLA